MGNIDANSRAVPYLLENQLADLLAASASGVCSLGEQSDSCNWLALVERIGATQFVSRSEFWKLLNGYLADCLHSANRSSRVQAALAVRNAFRAYSVISHADGPLLMYVIESYESLAPIFGDGDDLLPIFKVPLTVISSRDSEEVQRWVDRLQGHCQPGEAT